tara:strand:- start:2846 stop:3694 length:849 start_codon:yes stop_codon:yes gene_type:complete
MKTIKPFVKWAGGKSKMLKNKLFLDLLSRFDNSSMRYIEPFVGGGAVFFHLEPNNAIINDFNKELIDTYKILSDNIKTQKLLERIDVYYQPNRFDEDFYYNERSLKYSDQIKSSARFIYLNKRCFNGLYRVNKKNEFNVPFGKYKTVTFYDKTNIDSITRLLNNNSVDMYNLDYIKLKDRISFSSNDFVYIDPPYKPNNDSGFTEYTKKDFKDDNQIQLMKFCKELNSSGCLFIAHNNNNKYIRDIYSDDIFNIHDANINHTIGGKRDTMKNVKEIIITNIK